MSQTENQKNVVKHVMQAGAAGTVDQTELLRAANAVAAHVRADDEPVPAKLEPATAARMLDAMVGLAERAGIARADAGELKNTVTPGSTQPAEAKGDGKAKKDEDEDKEATLADVVKLLGNVSDRLDSIGKRCDALEGKGGKEEDDKDLPEPLAADDARHRSDGFKARSAAERADNALCDWRNEDRFAEFQSRCDAVASLFGQKAARPMQGETLGSFKRRSVQPWLSLSPTYKNVDLKVLGVADAVAFNVAVDDVLTCARAEGQRPSRVPAGFLAERIEQRGGHTYTRFYGAPKSWMNEFMPQGRRVKTVRQIAADGRIEGTLYQKG